MDKRVDTCEQRNGNLSTRDQILLDKRVKTFEKQSRYLWTREQRLLVKRVEAFGQENRIFVESRAKTCGLVIAYVTWCSLLYHNFNSKLLQK